MRAKSCFRLSGVLAAAALLSSGGSAQTTPTATAAPVTVRGQVVNALSGAGIPRALVTAGQRSVLTDAQGAFTFPEFTDPLTTAVRVQKPGYSPTLNPLDQAIAPVADLSQPVKLILYPDGLITGTVTGADGEPLERLSVSAQRATYDTTGLHGQNAGNSITDSHGQYRFRVAPGQYRVQLRYSPRVDGANQAVLPQSFPADPATNDAGFVRLGSGEQKVFDLRPMTGPTHKVELKVDGADVQFGLQFTATDPAGSSFQIGGRVLDGEATVMLPSGSYLLRALTEGRGQTLEGLVKVNVSGHDLTGIPLHLTSAAVLPIEASFDASNVSTQTAPATVSPQSFNLSLHSVTANASEISAGDLRPTPRGDGSFEFHVPSGRYRLRGIAAGNLSIESATYGQTSLLTGEVLIGAGSAGATIRLVATNKQGRISGTVQPAASDPAGTIPQGWIYLLAEFPSLTPFTKMRITRRGTWSASLLPGNYAALAVPRSLEVDLTNPEVAARFSHLGKTIAITDGGQVSLDLQLAIPDSKETP